MSESTATSSAAVLQALINGPQDLVIFALDREYRYLAFNEAHRHVIKQIWGVDIQIGMDMLAITARREDDHAKAKVQFDRALSGEHFVVIDAYGDDKLSRRTYRNGYGPLKDESGAVIGLTCFLSDVTEQVRTQEELDEYRSKLETTVQDRTRALERSQDLEGKLAQRMEELAHQAEERAKLVEQLRVAVQELSTPIIEVWDDVLALPVVGVVDPQRGSQMIERLLDAVTRMRCRYVILDLTGVSMIDTGSADMFVKLARAVKMLGADCILSGVQPAVAQTLITLQVELGLLTERNLKQALEVCIRGRGAR